MSLDERFQAAVDIVQKLPKSGALTTSNDQKLNFYSLFKQSTIGNVNTERPGLFSPVERKKWDSWKAVDGMDSSEAKNKYIEALLEMFDNIDENQINLSEWLNGPDLDPSIKKNLAFLGKSV